MGKFFAALVTSRNEIIYFDQKQRDLIKNRQLRDKRGNVVYDADSHSSIASFNFFSPYEEDAYNKIEFNPYNSEIKCKSLVFPLDEKLIREKIINEVGVYALNNAVDFSVKPFKFENYTKQEMDKFLGDNEQKIESTLRKFKKIESNVPSYYDSTMINGVWDRKDFELVHDNVLVPSTPELEGNLVGEDIKINNALCYSLRNFLMLSLMTKSFKSDMVDTDMQKIDAKDYQFLADNHFAIACDGKDYRLYARVDGNVVPVYELKD